MQKLIRRAGAAIAAAVALTAAAWFYRGFFFPDPYAVRIWFPLSLAILWGVRIVLPMLVVGAAWMTVAVMRKRFSVAGPALAFASVVLLLVLLYPLADLWYHRAIKIRRRGAEAHPFLQTAPAKNDSALGRPGQGFRIFCLGGSTTEYPDSRGRDWPSRVQERLRAALDRKDIQVVNCGRQGYTTLHMLVYYETRLRPLRPDAIVLMETINDLIVNADFCYFSGGPFQPDYGHYYGRLTRVFNCKPLLSEAAGFLGRLWYFPPRQIVEQDAFPGLASFRRNLETLAELARKDGIPVVFMTQPNLYSHDMTAEEEKALGMLHNIPIGPDRQWSLSTAANGFRQYREAVIESARQTGTSLIDLEAAIPRTLEYFYDDVHYEDKAYDLVAQTVADGLLKVGITHRKSDLARQD